MRFVAHKSANSSDEADNHGPCIILLHPPFKCPCFRHGLKPIQDTLHLVLLHTVRRNDCQFIVHPQCNRPNHSLKKFVEKAKLQCKTKNEPTQKRKRGCQRESFTPGCENPCKSHANEPKPKFPLIHGKREHQGDIADANDDECHVPRVPQSPHEFLHHQHPSLRSDEWLSNLVFRNGIAQRCNLRPIFICTTRS